MIEVTKVISFEAAHRLSKHRGACRNIHGHTYTLAVTLAGEATLDDKVLDFKELSSLLRDEFIDGVHAWDHALVLNPADPLLANDGFVSAISALGLRLVRMRTAVDPTAESMVAEVLDRLAGCGVPLGYRSPYGVVRVELFETPTSSARWSTHEGTGCNDR
jgi:6-pyruvoyltetrahydropterin/6-carboxytetrahydropterin synthase